MKTFLHFMLCVVALTMLMCGVACAPGLPEIGQERPAAWRDVFGEQAIVSVEQIKQLSCLKPEQATRADVVKILGEPTFESRKPTRAEVVKALGKEHVDRYYPNYPEQGPGETIMAYITGAYGVGKEVRFLMVSLKEERYEGYIWEDSAALLPSEHLAKAKLLIVKNASHQELRETLGPPARAALLNRHGVHWSYKFQPPESVVDLGISVVTLAWTVDTEAEDQFYGMTPEFVWRHEDPFGMLHGSPETVRDRKKLEHEYHAIVEGEIRSSLHVKEREQIERAEAILARLLKASPREVGAVYLLILESQKINAHAHRSSSGPVIILGTGLLSRLQDDDELAGVIGHELGHIVEGHFMVPIEYVLRVSPTPQMFRWSQSMEHAADVRGTEMVARAGYDPAGLDRVLKMLGELAAPVPKRLSTHPPHEMRRKLLAWYCSYREFRGQSIK